VRWSTEQIAEKCANPPSGSFSIFSDLGTLSPDPGDNNMNAVRLIAIALLVAGALGLAYGGFSYTKDTTAVKLGSLELSVKEKKEVNIPLWAGVAAMVAGGLLLVSTSKRG
jgi:hypothetical protein